jgi:hypothetical protein
MLNIEVGEFEVLVTTIDDVETPTAQMAWPKISLHRFVLQRASSTPPQKSRSTEKFQHITDRVDTNVVVVELRNPLASFI